MKGFLGSANVDTNSRLCMASSVAGHRRAFGADIVPGSYADLDEADLIVLVGSNAAWCHPVLFQRMMRNRRERGAKIVVIDPRRTATGEEADLFLPIAPGTDTALFCGLLVHLADTGALDHDYIDAHTTGFDDALARAREIAPDVAATAARDRPRRRRRRALLRSVPRQRSASSPAISQGVNQSAQGTDKVNAIINCHLATGRIGRPGMGPFSLTGQPNAMGGREVGGLANQLAAHMGFAPDEIDRVRRFWNAPRMAEREGLKAVQMFEAIERGEIKALWVMATNPAVSLPRAGAVREALKQARTVRRLRERAVERHRERRRACAAARRGLGREGRHRHQFRAAHLAPARLPAAAGRSQAGLVDRLARWRGAWASATRSPIASAADVFREHAALSAFENDGARDFDIGGLAAISRRGLRRARAGAMAGAAGEPPTRARASSPTAASSRPTARRASSRRSRRRCARRRQRRLPAAAQHRPHARPVAHHDAHRPEPAARRAPAGAVRRSASARRQARTGLTDGGFARVRTAHGACVAQGRDVSDGQQRGSLFVPIHWSGDDRLVGARRRSGLAADRSVLRPARGQGDAGAIAPVAFAYRGFALAARAARAAGRNLVGARRAARRGRHTCSRPTTARWSGTTSRTDAAFRDAVLTEYVDRRTASIAPRPSSTAELDGCAVRRPGRRAAAMGRDPVAPTMVGAARSRRSPTRPVR